MAQRRGQDIWLGLFVLVGLALLVVGSLWIAGTSFFGTPRSGYSVLLRDSAGVQAGDRVRLAGVSVGRVRSVNLRPEDDEWPVELRIALRTDIVLREDSSASIATDGLLGSAFLQVDPGSSELAPLPPGSEIHGSSPLGIDDALARADEITAKLTSLLDQASGVLDDLAGDASSLLTAAESLLSEQNAENVTQLLATLRSTLDDASPRIATMVEDLGGMAGKLREGTDGLPEMTQRIDGILAAFDRALGPDGDRLGSLVVTAERALDAAGDSFETLGGSREEIEFMLRDLADTAANLKALSQQLKERPFSLVRIRTDPPRSPGDGSPR